MSDVAEPRCPHLYIGRQLLRVVRRIECGTSWKEPECGDDAWSSSAEGAPPPSPPCPEQRLVGLCPESDVGHTEEGSQASEGLGELGNVELWG